MMPRKHRLQTDSFKRMRDNGKAGLGCKTVIPACGADEKMKGGRASSIIDRIEENIADGLSGFPVDDRPVIIGRIVVAAEPIRQNGVGFRDIAMRLPAPKPGCGRVGRPIAENGICVLSKVPA